MHAVNSQRTSTKHKVTFAAWFPVSAPLLVAHGFYHHIANGKVRVYYKPLHYQLLSITVLSIIEDVMGRPPRTSAEGEGRVTKC